MNSVCRIAGRFVVAASLAVALTAWSVSAAPDPKDDVELTEEEESGLRVEAVKWAEKAVSQAKAAQAKAANKARTATGTARDTLKKESEIYGLAAVYYQAYVDAAGARAAVMKHTLAVNSALQAKRSADDAAQAKAQLNDQHAKLGQAREAQKAAEDAYRAAVGDRVLDPYTAVTQQLARRKAAKK